jgi:hypothetical protein
MRSCLSNNQTSTGPSPSYRQPPSQSSNTYNSSKGKRSGGDPFTDVELGNTGNSSYAVNNDSGQYKDNPSDPYAGRPSDEVREYELEQQQVSPIHQSQRSPAEESEIDPMVSLAPTS